MIETSEEMFRGMAERLTELRTKVSLSQVDLANRTKIAQQAISKLETCFHKKFPPLDTAFKLATYFKVSKEYLLFGTEPMPQETLRLIKAWEEAPTDLKMEVLMMLWPKR